MKKSDKKFVDVNKAKEAKLKAKAKAAKAKEKAKMKEAKLKAKVKAAKAKEKAKLIKEKAKAKAAKLKAKMKAIKAKEKAKAKAAKLKAKLTNEKVVNKRIKKESVMVLKKDSATMDAKAILNAERDAIKTVLKNCKMHAKELAKIEDDEMKQNMIAKLIKMGYSFDLSDPTKLSVMVNVGCTVVPKMKKLKSGAKAVSVEQPNEKPETTEPVVEKPIVEATTANEDAEQTQPIEVPIGDTFTDAPIADDVASYPNEPSDEELNEIEAEEIEQPNENPEDDLAEYRADFFGRLAEDGDDSNL